MQTKLGTLRGVLFWENCSRTCGIGRSGFLGRGAGRNCPGDLGRHSQWNKMVTSWAFSTRQEVAFWAKVRGETAPETWVAIHSEIKWWPVEHFPLAKNCTYLKAGSLRTVQLPLQQYVHFVLLLYHLLCFRAERIQIQSFRMLSACISNQELSTKHIDN